MADEQPDFEHTLGDAIEEGQQSYVAEGVTMTDSVLAKIRPAHRNRLARYIRELYDSGVYADPPSADPDPEGKEGAPCGPDFAIYEDCDLTFWVQPNRLGITIMLPEDY